MLFGDSVIATVHVASAAVSFRSPTTHLVKSIQVKLTDDCLRAKGAASLLEERRGITK